MRWFIFHHFTFNNLWWLEINAIRTCKIWWLTDIDAHISVIGLFKLYFTIINLAYCPIQRLLTFNVKTNGFYWLEAEIDGTQEYFFPFRLIDESNTRRRRRHAIHRLYIILYISWLWFILCANKLTTCNQIRVFLPKKALKNGVQHKYRRLKAPSECKQCIKLRGKGIEHNECFFVNLCENVIWNVTRWGMEICIAKWKKLRIRCV